MGALLYFTETTLLWIVACVCLAGLGWRLCWFIVAIFHKRAFSRYGSWHRMVTLAGVLMPFHRAVFSKPVYTALRYGFHVCLFSVPVWFSGHIYIWEESRFAWYWTPMPDTWADGMTLAVLGACLFFTIRRLVLARRLETGISDFFLIGVTAMPFLTGYFLTHGTLEGIPFFDSYLWYVHVISGELMLLSIVFLFCRTRLNKGACVGCAACVETCPTETLTFNDQGKYRLFRYSHYQCICCGACVDVCPEGAASLGHDLHPANLIRVFSPRDARKVELKTCDSCGVHFAPVPQLDKLYRSVRAQDIEVDAFDYCQRCKSLRSSMQNRRRALPVS